MKKIVYCRIARVRTRTYTLEKVAIHKFHVKEPFKETVSQDGG
jgi:hypothetical protein